MKDKLVEEMGDRSLYLNITKEKPKKKKNNKEEKLKE